MPGGLSRTPITKPENQLPEKFVDHIDISDYKPFRDSPSIYPSSLRLVMKPYPRQAPAISPRSLLASPRHNR